MKTALSKREARVACCAAVLGLISLILFAVLSTDGESGAALVPVIILLVAAIAITVISLLKYDAFLKKPLLLSCARFATTLCYAIALCRFVQVRVDWLFRLLSKMVAAPLTALFPVTIIAFVITLIVHVVSTFRVYDT